MDIAVRSLFELNLRGSFGAHPLLHFKIGRIGCVYFWETQEALAF